MAETPHEAKVRHVRLSEYYLNEVDRRRGADPSGVQACAAMADAHANIARLYHECFTFDTMPSLD